MRIQFFVLSVLLLLVTLSAAVEAKILLPSDDGDSATSNLGLMPRAPSAAGNNAVKPVDPEPTKNDAYCATPEGCGEAPNIASTLLGNTKDSLIIKQKPFPKGITPGGKLASPIKETAKTDQQKETEKLRAKGILPQTPMPRSGQNVGFMSPRPPIFVDEPQGIDLKANFDRVRDMIRNNPSLTNINAKIPTLSNNINIAVSPEYLWGPKDVEKINKILGYTPDKIPSHCQLRLKNRMNNNAGYYDNSVFAGQRENLDFDGPLSEIKSSPTAVCDPPSGNLPQNGGVIARIGDKYSISLGKSATCNSGKGKARSLEIQYKGDNEVNCRFN